MKLHPKARIYLAFLVILVFAASCQKPFHEENERYFFVSANINLPYWQEAKAGFYDAAQSLGVKGEFVGPTSYSPEEQLTAFQQAVAAHPAGILISPTRPELFKDAIDAAVRNEIPVVCVDSDAPESRRFLFVGTDNFQAGMQSGRRMAELLHGQGRVVVVTIPGQLNLDERLRGVKEAFSKYPGIHIIKVVDDKGDPRIANDEISALLPPKEKIDGIVCLEASRRTGPPEVMHRANLEGKNAKVANDKDPETLDWIQRGVISATIGQKPYTMSFYALKFADDLHHNIVHEFKDWRAAPTSPLPVRVDTGTAAIDAKNLAAFRAAQAKRPEF
jgi:ribose transport system substrate-binding protein